MRNPVALIRELVKIRPHFSSVGSWLLEPIGRGTRHLRLGAGNVCEVRTTALGNVWLRLGDSDFRTLLEISRGEYEICAQRVANPAGVFILDLGANVGLSCRLWRIRFPDAKIVAIEPDPGSVRVLRMNIRDGSRADLTEIIEAAVTCDGKPVLLDQSGDSDSHKIGSSGIAVAGIMIGEAIQRAAGPDGMVDLLKMDIEGSEQGLMQCAGSWARKVRHLLIEVHGEYTESRFRSDLSRVPVGATVEPVRAGPGVATFFVTFSAHP
jgi:FkbM family methyltransferase